MSRYLLRRVFGLAGVVAGLLIFTFLATYVIGDATLLLVDDELATDEDRAAVEAAGGFDRSLTAQFVDFAGSAVQGDFGRSIWQNRPATEVVLERVPATLLLTGLTIGFVFLVAVPAAIWAARNPGRWPAGLVTGVSLMLTSVTPFWLAIALILIFAVNLTLLPTSGYGSWQQAILPVLALAAQPIGQVTQVLHASLSGEMRQLYVTTARAKGLKERTVAVRHVCRNTAIVGITLLGGLVAGLLNGAVLAEAIFAWPGVGDVSLEAVQRRDLPVLMAAVFYVGLLVATVNLLIDLAYVAVDPRVRLR